MLGVCKYGFEGSGLEILPESIALEIGNLIFKQVVSLTSKINVFQSSLWRVRRLGLSKALF